MKRLDARICTQLIVALLLWVAVPSGMQAQDPPPTSQASDAGETNGSPDKATNEAAAEPAGSDELASSKDITPSVANSSRTPSPLAVPQWRGYSPRWIALYGSQLADLIPESFRPISINDLADALRDDSLQMQPPSDVPVASLTVVAHIASECIVSTECQLVLPGESESSWESSRDPLRTSWQRYQLGEMNLQLLEPSKDQRSATAAEIGQPRARILSGANGNCFAWGKPGSTIDFAWSVRGQHIANGRQWTLQLPATTTTRFFLSVAKDWNIAVSGGSVTRLVETPSWGDLGLDSRAVERLKADSSHRQDAIHWYSIEPTPGQQLVLTQRPSGQSGTAAESMNIVRGCQMQSRWVGDQLRWTCRMTMDASSSFSFTELAWADGEVTAVRRDNVSIPFVWTGNTARWNEMSVAGPLEGAAPSGKLRMTSTMWVMEGVSRRSGDHLPLPRPLLPADRFIVPPQTWHLQLDLPTWGELSDVRLPPAWDLRRLSPDNTRLIDSANPESSGVDRVAADKHEPVVTWMASGPAPAPNEPWSISIFSNDSIVFADHQMRFEMDESSIQVRGKVTVEMPPDAIGPITFDLQDGFQFEFIGVGEARRSIPTGTAAGHGRRLTIWPSGDEVVNDRVIVHVNGRARRTNIADRSALDPPSSSALISPDVTTQQPGAVAGDAEAKAHQPAFDLQAPPVDAAVRESGSVAIGDESAQRTKSLWLMRAVDCPGQLLATIVPPAGLSWSAKAAIEPSRITIADLSTAQRRFFAPLPGDAIVFGGAIEATPEVTLEKPDVNLSVSLRTLLRTATRTLAAESISENARQPDVSSASELPAPLWQTLEVKTEGTAGEIRTMRLRFAARPPHDDDGSPTPPDGPGTDRTTDDHQSESSAAAVDPPPWVPMQWFVQLQPGQTETPLAERAVRRLYVESAGDWEVRIELPPLFTNQSILVGRRRLDTLVDRQAFAIGLPNVPDAASQSAEIWIDSSLQLNEHPETLKGVPVVDSSWSEPSPASAMTPERGEFAFSPTSTIARYRYAPNDQPWVVVTPRAHQPPRGLIVNQRLFAKASVNGTDVLRMICLAKSSSEILLTFPPSMHLVELRCDGQLVTARRVPGRGVVITLPEPLPPPPTSPRSTTSPNEGSDASAALPNEPTMRSYPPGQNWRRLEMNWISQTPLSHWYRWYQFPEIEFDQMVVDSHFELSTAAGTHLLQIPDFTRAWFSGSAPLLLQTGLIAGIGWVTALFLLALACLVSRRGLGILGSGILVTAVAVVLWPTAAIPLIAFVAVPLTLAALQRATALWHSRREDDADDSEMNADTSPQQASHGRHAHATNLLWWMSLTIFFLNSLGSARHAVGQQTSPPSFSANSVPDPRDNAGQEKMPAPGIDVLVPLQNDGKLLGNKIYVPEAFYNDLYFGNDRMPWHDPMIDRVSYHLRLKSPLDSSSSLLDTGTLFGNDSFSNDSSIGMRPRDATGNSGEINDEMLSQRNVATLQARIQLTLPASVRRIRLPYRFDQIDAVTQLSAIGDPMTVRWGGESDVGAWVDIPALGRDFENVELMVSLRCQLHWQDPWITVSCDLPRLPAANLVVTSNDAIRNVMLLTSKTSCFVALHATPNGSDVPAPTSSTLSVASMDSEARKSDVIALGSHRQLNLQFQFESSAATAIAKPAIGPRAPSDPGTESVAAIDPAILPWYDPTQWQQRYWVHSGSGKTVIECELESLQSLPPEVTLQLTTISPQVIAVASDGKPAEQQSEEASTLPSPQPCVLLGRHWSLLARDDEPSTNSRDLSVVSLSSPSRPIRLAWTLQTPVQGSWRIKMPRVWPQPSTDRSVRNGIANEANATQPGGNRAASEPQRDLLPWIAWSFASDVEPDWSTLVQSEPIAVDQFYAKWTGYLSSIDRATKGSVQELTVSRVSETSWSVGTRHEISIQPNAQRVHYMAHVTASKLTTRDSSVDAIAPSAPTVGATRYVIRLPERARLLDWQFETEGKAPVSPLTLPPTSPSEVTQSGVPTVDPTETDGALSSTTASSHVPIWTVSRKDGATTLYITTDQSSFDITVDAIVPHQSGNNANELGLIDIRKVSSTTSPQAHDDGEDADANDPGWADDVKQTNEVQITRDVDTIIQWIHPVTITRIETAVADAASLLADGEIVVDRFRPEGSIFQAFESARFRAVTNNRPFDVDSRITLRWEEGRWTAQTDCRITSSYCPDYVDIAIPTRWCESLRIDPHCVSSRQPTLDPAMQVLRLQLRNDSPAEGNSQHTRTFQLISRLAVSEITRVSVPELRVMGSRQHRIDVVVPTRLTNEQVRWRSNFAGPIEKPRWRIQPRSEITSAANATAIESSQDPESELSVYAVTNSRWSIDLETLPRTDRVARLLHTDHSVIVQPGSESLVMVSRFDIVPGDQPTLRLSIDRSVQLQGVWAATQQADLQPIASSQVVRGSRQSGAVVWEVSLPLSRLSQTVEVLTLLRHETADVLLPSLIGLSLDAPRASVNWSQRPASNAGTTRTIDEVIGGEDATPLDSDRFHNDPRSVALIASPLPPQTRLAWLASNVVKAIRASSDSLADRRDDEVAAWLGPWIARYQMLCDAAGRQIGDDDPKETASLNGSDSVQTAPSSLHPPSRHGIPPGDLLSWQEMDAYVVAQETRYFPGGTFAGETASLSWSDDLAIRKPPGYVDRWTFAWSGRRLPIQALAVQRPPLSERTRQLVMRSGLFFVLFSLLMVAALLPRRNRSEVLVNDSETRVSWADMTLNPSLWLFVLGIIGLILMPLPMALGVLVVAVAFGASQMKRWVVSQWKVSLQERAST